VLDLLLSTTRNLRAHALRFFLTSLGIIWGAFMLTFLGASMKGVADQFENEMENTGPKIVVVYPGSVIKNRVGERGARAVELEAEDVERLSAYGSVEEASPNLVFWSQIVRAGRRTKLLNVNGVNANAQRIRSFDVAEGRFISPVDVERSERVAFLGAVAARRLFGGLPAVGRRIQIESQSYRVIGVAKEKGRQMVGVVGRDDTVVLIPYTTAMRRIQHTDIVSSLVFAPETRDRSWEAMRRARETFGLHHGFPPELETAISFFNIHDVMQILFTIQFGVRIFLVSAGVITLLVGAVGVMNIMLVVVGERTNEIGLRKAVGASGRAIFLQFFAEAGAVCGLSGLLGALLGVGFAQLFGRLGAGAGPVGSPPVIDPFIVTVTVAALFVVGMVAGLAPAIRAARIPPAEALRAS